MKKHLFLFLMLLACIGNSYCQQMSEYQDKLSLQVTPSGLSTNAYDCLDNKYCMSLKIAVKNLSSDTITYMIWVGDAECIFETNNAKIRLVHRTAFDSHVALPIDLSPNATEEATLYLIPPDKKSMQRKFKVGMHLIAPSPTKRLDWDFLEREPYATIWSNEITLNN